MTRWPPAPTSATILPVNPESTAAEMPALKKTAALGLLRRRQVYLPTWRGWLLLLLCAAGLFLLFLLRVQPFLALGPDAP